MWANDNCPQSSRNTKAMISLNSIVMQLNWKTGYKEQSYDLSLQCGGFRDGCHCYIPQEWGPWLQNSSPSLSVGYMLSFWLCHSICMLGSFQCWGILLCWHIVGQDPVGLAAGAGMEGGGLVFYFLSHFLSSPSYAPSLGRWLDMTAVLLSQLLTPTLVISYYKGGGVARLVLVNRLVGLSLQRNSG